MSIGTTDGHFAFQEEYTLPKFRYLLYFFKNAYFTISVMFGIIQAARTK